MAVTRRAIHSDGDNETRIHRAKFSAITPKAIQDAFATLEQPDPDLSRSVDARQELDLRIGVAMTRLLTWRCVNIARKRFSPSTRMIVSKQYMVTRIYFASKDLIMYFLLYSHMAHARHQHCHSVLIGSTKSSDSSQLNTGSSILQLSYQMVKAIH